MLKISDIAKHAGVSSTTVSFVLNERHEALRISEKTRLKVLESAEELGYRSNQWARAIRTGNTKMLGVLGGNPAEEHVGRMLTAALETAHEHGYTLQILQLNAFGGDARQVIRRSSELRMMGVLALHLPEEILAELHTEAHDHGTPLVLLDARCRNLEITQVASDDEGGIQAGVEHLVQLGHSKIAFIEGHGEPTVNEGSVRTGAFRAAMARHRLRVPPEYVGNGHFYFREQSVQAARNLLTLPPDIRPTAIFCSGDFIALAAMQVANELQLSVPRDISVIGFADVRAAEFATPQLTTVHQPFEELGRTAVETLLGIVGNASGKATQPDSTTDAGEHIKVLPTRLVQRASTAAPNKYAVN